MAPVVCYAMCQYYFIRKKPAKISIDHFESLGMPIAWSVPAEFAYFMGIWGDVRAAYTWPHR